MDEFSQMGERHIVLFFAYHRLHLFVYRELFAALRARGCEPICAVFGEHIRSGQIEPALLDSLEPDCRVEVLAKTTSERLVSRVLTRHFPGNTRDRRWGKRAARLIGSVRRSLRSVVVPLEVAGRHIRRPASKYARFVAVQYEPFIQHGKRKVIASLEADLLCTWGELDSKALRAVGVRSPIYAAGSPVVRLEPNFVFPALDEGRGLRILYTTTPLLRRRRLDFAVPLPYTREDYRQMKLDAMSDLEQILGEFPGTTVAVKLHPMDEGLVERDCVAARAGSEMVVVEHEPATPIQSHIENCDLLITMGSTTAFQAITAGKPVVFLNYGNWTGKHEMNYLAYNFGLAAIDGQSLMWAIRQTLQDEATQQMLERGRAGYLGMTVSHDGDTAVRNLCAAILGDELAIRPSDS